MNNHEIIAKGFAILRDQLAPYVAQQLMGIPEYKANDRWWLDGILGVMNEREQSDLFNGEDFGKRIDSLDIAACLNLLDRHWNNLFVYRLPRSARSWAKEIKEARNTWAHIGGKDFADKEASRALDTMALLAGEIDAEAQADIQKLIRASLYGSEMGSLASNQNAAMDNASTGKKSPGVMQTTPVNGLPCWRNVIEPHPDVAQGRYKNAEFAADLAQVARGEGAYEYRDPIEFFSRTYVTEGMKGLLVQALRRVGGKDGEPVIQLKTAFGGGKTHSMLALYHLLRGRASSAKLPNIKAVLEAAEIERPTVCRVAVLVGTALEPAKSKRLPNLPGITVNTLWGEMAAQLALDAGNPKLYDMVKDSDKKGVAPGSETLKNLFDACGPCIVLIDELVAYAKLLYRVDGLPAGSFDNLITFIQQITEAARASQNSLVVASIPESKIEVGEDGGQKALEAIEHTFGRMESIWKPVAANEGFEIVRRRLFLNCKNETGRDQVCQTFSQMYQENSADFPMDAKEVDYLQRMRSCYPIHPEIFDRLYEDWATIERFQKTRGVLRLMAAVVHNLWMNQDGGLLILPGSISLDVPTIRDELTRHVGDQWNPIVDHEVDGKSSTPYQKDQEVTRFGKLMAARRVARTVMLGSAPSERSQGVRGLEASRIRLGVVQPGENIATFNDALNTLQTSLTYLYSNPSNDRFWFDTRPTLRKTVEDRASQRSHEQVEEEIEHRLNTINKERPFGRVHRCPNSSLDVSDDQDVGLVILNVGDTYKANASNDHAIRAAEMILNTRGTAPRIYRNMLAFVAPDQNTMPALKEEVKRFLAWKSIKEDSVDLNLDAAQNRVTEDNLLRSNKTVDDRIQETFCWLLVPYIDREVDLKTVIWDAISIRGGQDSIVVKAARKMQQNAQLITQWAPILLLMELDKLLWKEKNDISVGELWKLLCTYCYLPRLASFDVLASAIQNGVNSEEYFAYADGVSDGRYLGLKYNQYVGLIDRSGYVVKQMAALKQIATGGPKPPVTPGDQGDIWTPPVAVPNFGDTNPPVQPQPPTPSNRHFYMTATLDTTRVVKNIGHLMDEVINHLTQVNGAKVVIKLDVEASMPDGAPVTTVRTVTENCRTLKVEDFGFDE